MSTIPTVSDSTREPHSHDVRLAVSTTPTQVLREDSRGGASPRGNLVIALAAGERVMFRENNLVIGELTARRVGGSRGGKYMKIVLSFGRNINIKREGAK